MDALALVPMVLYSDDDDRLGAAFGALWIPGAAGRGTRTLE